MSRDGFLPDNLGGTVLGLKVLVGAMMIGPTIFLAVVFFLDLPVEESDQPRQIMTMLAAALACVAVVLRFALPTVKKPTREAVESALKDRNDGRAANLLTEAYRASTIVSVARFEGAALLAGVAYMLERQPLALGLAILMIAAVGSHIPTRDGFVGWLENQRRHLRG